MYAESLINVVVDQWHNMNAGNDVVVARNPSTRMRIPPELTLLPLWCSVDQRCHTANISSVHEIVALFLSGSI